MILISIIIFVSLWGL